ncbi:MAG: Lrp/AsnC family transcriptional regulator [Xanthobacteraceae bacterium]
MKNLDAVDRTIINGLQGGFPLDERPFRTAGARLGLDEEELIARVRRLVEEGALSRFGPMWNAEALGGDVCLCAMAVPPERFDAVAEQVNAHAEVAHNYERSHDLNMWFVISAERTERIAEVAAEIETETGLTVYRMPKRREFFVGFRVEV